MFPSLRLSFLPAFLVLKQLRCQHKSQFSLPHPPHCSTLSLSNSLTGPNTVHALQQSPAVSYAPSLLRKGNATTKGSSGVTFNLTTLFDYITLTSAILRLQARSLPVIDHKGEG